MPDAKPRIRSAGLTGLLLAALGTLSSGCAFFARPPETPARQVNYKQLNDPCPTGDRYYLLVFGSQTVPKLPRYTHTWVTFAHMPPTSPTVVEENTISWMPAKLFINTFNPTVEPGVNLSLHDSIKMAEEYGERVSLWGPYEIPSGLYRKALIQKKFLESGAIGYQCIDTIGEARDGSGSNCIHAISDSDSMFNRQAYPLAFFGDSASLHILRQLAERGAVPDPYTTHDWVIAALKLEKYDIVRREYSPPLLTGPLRLPVIQASPDDPGP
jgi:hypothetical protein